MWILPKIHCQPSAWRLGRGLALLLVLVGDVFGQSGTQPGKKTYAPNGFTTQDVWHGELSNISLKSSMFRNIVSNHGFYSFFFQVKCFQSPFCCSFCNQQVPFHEMDFLSLNNQDFILNCPRAVIPPHFFCFVAGCPYDSPDLRAWWNSLNSEILSRNNSRRGRFALEIQSWTREKQEAPCDGVPENSWWGWNLLRKLLAAKLLIPCCSEWDSHYPKTSERILGWILMNHLPRSAGRTNLRLDLSFPKGLTQHWSEYGIQTLNNSLSTTFRG